MTEAHYSCKVGIRRCPYSGLSVPMLSFERSRFIFPLRQGAVGGFCLLRHIHATQTFKHAIRLVNNTADGLSLLALGIQLVLHHSDQLLARLVRAVLVENMVKVEEKCLEVLNLLGPLQRLLETYLVHIQSQM